MNTLINLSGGVDSTYYTWRWLRENPQETLLIHHCLLFEKRKQVEKTATDSVLKYFTKHGLRNYRYAETTFSRVGIIGKIYDIEPLYYMTGLVAKAQPVTTIIMPRCKEEVKGNHELNAHLARGGTLNNYAGNGRVAKAMMLANMAAGKRYNYISPYQDMGKQDMIDAMPDELFAMTWYCRRPIDNAPCMKCFNCRRVHKKIRA